MRRFLSTLLALAAIAAGLVVLALVIGAFLPPTLNILAVVGAMVWAPIGPALLLVALAAFGGGLLARRSGALRLGGLALGLAGAGIIGSAFILSRIWLATVAAGGAIDLPSTLMPARMDSPGPDAVEDVRVVEGVALRAAIWQPPPGPEPAPVIVYIHGGGFMIGTNTETAADLRWFADRGWLVISLAYRLFPQAGPTWDKAPEDVACGLVWAGQNAARLGGDPARIALLGDSAGGNLAINLGFAAAAGLAPAVCGAEVPVPSAIAALYPAVDPMSIYERGWPIPGFEPTRLIEGYLGGRPADHPDRVRAVASAGFVTDRAPPTLVVLPVNDSLVVASGTRDFARVARAAGVPLELVEIPYANHVFNQIAANSLGNQIGRTVRLRFLAQHFR